MKVFEYFLFTSTNSPREYVVRHVEHGSEFVLVSFLLAVVMSHDSFPPHSVCAFESISKVHLVIHVTLEHDCHSSSLKQRLLPSRSAGVNDSL